MKRNRHRVLIVTIICALSVICYIQRIQAADDWLPYRDLNYVIVTPNGPDDGGDFGPRTPGTKTCGIQEALDYALHSPKPQKTLPPDRWSRKHVYICKGWYYMEETLTIPWMGEQFRLEGLDSHIGYLGAKGNAIVIDSQMNCHIKIGYVVAPNLKEGNVVLCKPQTPFSYAPRGVMSNSIFEFYAIVGGGSVAPDQNRTTQCKGLVLDSSSGPIICNKFIINEINACDTSMYIRNAEGGGIQHNHIELFFGNICNTTLRMGDPGCRGIVENILRMNCNGKVGAQIFAQKNLLTLTGLVTEPQKSIIFEADARDNIVYALNMYKGITNNADTPTNRIITTEPVGFSVPTPPVAPSGTPLVNRQPFSIDARILTPGAVSAWTQTDARGQALSIDGSLIPGQSIILDPGDAITFNYKEPPTWKWKALN